MGVIRMLEMVIEIPMAILGGALCIQLQLERERDGSVKCRDRYQLTILCSLQCTHHYISNGVLVVL